MSVIVAIHLETDLSEFTSTVTDSGDLYWAAAAALAGTAGGMAMLLDDTTAIYGTKTVATNTSGKLRARFYLDPNSLIMANLDQFYVLFCRNSTPAEICSVDLYYATATGYSLVARAKNDAGTSVTQLAFLSDAPHYVEIYLQRAATNISSDGSLTWWIDGTAKTSITSLDNYDRFPNFVDLWWGAAINVDAGTSGTFYLDELVVNDDGGVIGPLYIAKPKRIGNPSILRASSW